MAQDKTVGFIGLGDLGKHMVSNLVNRTFNVSVFDVRKEPVEELKALGAIAANSSEEVAKVSDVVITMVRDDAQTDEVIYGRSGVLKGAREGSVIILSSTIHPLHCRSIASEAERRGVKVLDAPVSGGRVGARAGTLTFMVGGDRATFEECHPIFEAMGRNIFYLGVIGMGEVCKLAHNLVFFINLAGLSEGIALGLKAGLELEPLINVIKTGAASSWLVQNWELVRAQKDEYDQCRRSSTLGLIYKDMDLALKMARDIDQFVPLAAFCAQLDISSFFAGVKPSSPY